MPSKVKVVTCPRTVGSSTPACVCVCVHAYIHLYTHTIYLKRMLSIAKVAVKNEKKKKGREEKGKEENANSLGASCPPALQGRQWTSAISGANWAGVCGGRSSCRTFPEPGPRGSSHHSWAPRPESPSAQRQESWRWWRVAGQGTATQTQTEARTHARRCRPGLARRKMDWERKQEGRSGAGQHRPHGQAPTLHAGLPHPGGPPGP